MQTYLTKNYTAKSVNKMRMQHTFLLVVRQIQQHEVETVVNFCHGTTFIEKVIVIFRVTLFKKVEQHK